jgi:epoxyqueuosine reductase
MRLWRRPDSLPRQILRGAASLRFPKTGPCDGTRLCRRLSIRLLDPLLGALTQQPVAPWFRFLPRCPAGLAACVSSPRGAWPASNYEVPTQLRTSPGIVRDRHAEALAYATAPLQDFMKAHPVAERWLTRRWWPVLIPVLPHFMQALHAVEATRPRSTTAPARRPCGAKDLTALLRTEAARVGLSRVGVARYEPKYTFREYAGTHDAAAVVVCALEQNAAATQTIPSRRAERAAYTCYAELMELAAHLAIWLQKRGYAAHAHSVDGETMVMHYAVEAGLGQLGLNGQVLTPQAGSRVRFSVITTNAPLEIDHPVDYGITPICDACKICVSRCPVGAIPATRRPYRGVTKAKLKSERCYPVVAQADGCAICMKVCPIQRYGLHRVTRTYLETGEILGKGTDELESFRWPLDGRTYGVGAKPRINATLISPPGWAF